MSRTIALGVAVATLCGGCLSFDEPAPSVVATPRSAAPTEAPRDQGEMVVEVPGDPEAFLPPSDDETTALLVDLLYDPLYRLDPHLVPQPELADGEPSVAADGVTWAVRLLDDLRFQDGTAMSASDVEFSLQVAGSPACPFGRDICDSVAGHLADVTANDRKTLTLALTEPFSPFQGEVLARLPILSQSSVRQLTTRLVAGAAHVPGDGPGKQVADIAAATNADQCLADAPPVGCKLSDYREQLEGTLRSANIPLPPEARFVGVTGAVDEEAYAGALLDRVAALDQVLTSSGVDQMAAALPLLDLVGHPIGSGPYVLDTYTPGEEVALTANKDHVGGAPGIERIRLDIQRDPSTASTRLLTGQADWLLTTSVDRLTALQSAPGVHAAGRPLPAQRAIVFNVRKGRVYEDADTRRAFGMCLDQAGLATQASGGTAVLATTPTSAGSWAMDASPPEARDVDAAVALLEKDGWQRGADGIFARSGTRLTSEVAVRPSRADLLAFAQGASEQLKDCGIELVVRELDLTGDLLLEQLQWPNDFDTVLVTRELGTDVDQDLEAYDSRHATSAENPADANPGGYDSEQVDSLIDQGRAVTDRAARARLYDQLQSVLARDEPAYPIWYDVGWSALADRVREGDGRPDPGQSHYWWDLPGWSLQPIAKATPATPEAP